MQKLLEDDLSSLKVDRFTKEKQRVEDLTKAIRQQGETLGFTQGQMLVYNTRLQVAGSTSREAAQAAIAAAEKTAMLMDEFDRNEQVKKTTESFQQLKDELISGIAAVDRTERENFIQNLADSIQGLDTAKLREIETLAGKLFDRTQAKDQNQAVDDLIKDLENERAELKLNSREQFINAQIRAAGADITEEQAKRIREAADALFTERKKVEEKRVGHARDLRRFRAHYSAVTHRCVFIDRHWRQEHGEGNHQLYAPRVGEFDCSAVC